MVSLCSHLAGMTARTAHRRNINDTRHWWTYPAIATAVFLGAIGSGHLLRAAEPVDKLTAWLSAQTNIHTWSADFIQTRTLKALTQPLTAQGRVWFSAPNRFRWELGDPPQTIAIREPDQMWVIYPPLKRAERYPLTGEQMGPWRDALALLEAGFPHSRAEMEAKFRLIAQTETNDLVQVTLQPKSSGARRLMPQMKIAFSTNDFSLRATELQFADGSTLRNDFTKPQLNPKLDEALFEPRLPENYKIVEPLRK